MRSHAVEAFVLTILVSALSEVFPLPFFTAYVYASAQVFTGLKAAGFALETAVFASIFGAIFGVFALCYLACFAVVIGSHLMPWRT